MSCFHPIQAWHSPIYGTVFKSPKHGDFKEITVPCGRCDGCKIQRSRDWALRCIHEAQLHKDNCFITLTYDDEHLPELFGPRDFQLFMKRLRKAIKVPVRYFCCGEYGDLSLRPHFHLILFGYRPDDLKVYSTSVAGFVYESSSLDQIWGQGRVAIGDVSFASAAYVARYCLKKVATSSRRAFWYLDRKDHIFKKAPAVKDPYSSFVLMSRKPGIGSGWIERFHDEIFSKGYITFEGGSRAPPSRFYKNYFKKHDRDNFDFYRSRCLDYFERNSSEFTPERLKAKSLVLQEKLKFLKRNFDVC